jgi:hypothetical protein
MPCEKYQAALIDLAASAAEPSGALRAHLDECASCRSYMEGERFLAASIDSVLRQTANAPLPPALLQRLDARLAQQAPPTPALYPRSIYAGVAFVAAAFLLVVLPRFASHNANQQAVAPAAARQTIGREPEAIAHLAAPTSAASTTRRASKPNAQPPKASEPEVLVPPDERIAFEHFLADLNGREDLAIALVTPIQEQRQHGAPPVATPAPVDVPDLQTIALTVQPLSEVADR